MQYLLGGTQPRLSGRLQQVDEVVPFVQNMIMEIEEQLGPLVDWPSGPSDLSPAGQLCANLDIGRRRRG